MVETRKIKARDIVNDIRAGVTDADLMSKYRLSSRGLQSAFDKLVEAGAIRLEEIYGRSPSDDDTVRIDDLRDLPRHYLALAVSIFEPTRPEVKGKLREITEQGIGVIGIEARIGDTKSLVIPSGRFMEADRIWFEATCVWARMKGPGSESIAGFQITKISDKDLENLRQLIRLLALDG